MAKENDMEFGPFLQSLPKDKISVSQQLVREIFAQSYSLKHLGVSARVLQNWYDCGLLPAETLGPKKHSYNFIELFWLYIVKELREVGMPIPAILRTKKKLMNVFNLRNLARVYDSQTTVEVVSYFNPLTDSEKERLYRWCEEHGKNKEIPDFDESFSLKTTKVNDLLITLTQLLTSRQDSFLVVAKWGTPFFFTKESIGYFLEMLKINTNIVIPLNQFFYQFLGNNDSFEFLEYSGLLNHDEMHIIRHMVKGDADSITIKFKNSKPVILEVSEKRNLQEEARLVDILAKKKYQDVVIKTENGVIQYAIVTERNKLPTKLRK